jgi:hypothetical protein
LFFESLSAPAARSSFTTSVRLHSAALSSALEPCCHAFGGSCQLSIANTTARTSQGETEKKCEESVETSMNLQNQYQDQPPLSGESSSWRHCPCLLLCKGLSLDSEGATNKEFGRREEYYYQRK